MKNKAATTPPQQPPASVRNPQDQVQSILRYNPALRHVYMQFSEMDSMNKEKIRANSPVIKGLEALITKFISSGGKMGGSELVQYVQNPPNASTDEYYKKVAAMFNQLVKIANRLDDMGFIEEADSIDLMLRKYAMTSNTSVFHLISFAGDDLNEIRKSLSSYPIDADDISSRIDRVNNALTTVKQNVEPNEFANYLDSERINKVITFMQMMKNTFSTMERYDRLPKETKQKIMSNVEGAIEWLGDIYADNAEKYGLDMNTSRVTREQEEQQQADYQKHLQEMNEQSSQI